MSAKRWVIQPQDLIQPYFAVAGKNRKEPIPNMPGIFRLSADLIVWNVTALVRNGVRGVLLFGIARKKDALGSDAYDQGAAIQSATRELRKRFRKKIIIITDVCLCGFTDHGHCGILHGRKIDRKRTLRTLGRIAVSQAEAGADFVGPSAMTVGQVKAVRGALDRAGFSRTGVWAYAIKYASAFYGPFRDALGSVPQFGDRSAYQMDPADVARVMRSALKDQKDGADILMVKPALPYLDIIFRLKQKAQVPVAAFHVSGEYGMLKQASRADVFDEKRTVFETLLAIRRAGAKKIITYYAGEVAKWLKQK
ncbi:MAG: porphobilinogen synthase [Candidatus Omnitrophota bacterium]